MARLFGFLLILLMTTMTGAMASAQGGVITDPATGCGLECGGPANGYGQQGDDGGDDGLNQISPRSVAVFANGRSEFVTSGTIEEFEAVNALLSGLGAQLYRYRDLPRLGIRIAVYDLRGIPIARVRAALRQAGLETLIGRHDLYSLSQGRARLYAAQMIGDAAPGACPVRSRRAIGLIDGPVDPTHPALARADVVSRSFLTDGERPPAGMHGTAVAALLVGEDPDGRLGGFAPGADLYAVSAFTDGHGDAAADIDRIATGLEWLLDENVHLVNMSFAGPENPVMGDVLSRAAAQGVVMIAAAGNDGMERAAYPAAHPAVIAVTAVDAAFRRYRDANYGDHIEFAAPGVDLYVASTRGGSYASGTSYAAPIVTALAARLGAGGGLSTDALRARLRGSAVDLGPDGFDDQFGWGLVRGGC